MAELVFSNTPLCSILQYSTLLTVFNTPLCFLSTLLHSAFCLQVFTLSCPQHSILLPVHNTPLYCLSTNLHSVSCPHHSILIYFHNTHSISCQHISTVSCPQYSCFPFTILHSVSCQQVSTLFLLINNFYNSNTPLCKSGKV